MFHLTIEQHLLLFLYRHSRNYKEPKLLDLKQLASVWKSNPTSLKNALQRLQHKGFIRRTDSQGLTTVTRSTCEDRLVKLLLDNGCVLPWDKKSRMAIARKLGIKFNSLRVFKANLDHILMTEYDERNWPTQIRVSEVDALTYLEDKETAQTGVGNLHYYKYVHGWRRPRAKRKPQPKPRPRTRYHDILEYLVKAGGSVVGPAKLHYHNCGATCSFSSFRGALRQLRDRGMILKTNGHIEIRDAEAVSLFLSRPTEVRSIRPRGPVCLSSGLLSCKGLVTRENSSYATVSCNPPYPQTTVARLALANLILRKRLELQVAQMLLWYPRNYAKGQDRIVSTYREIKATHDDDNDLRRQQLGANWGKQKAIVFSILRSLQEHLGLGGPILDALVEEGITRLQGLLPTLDSPDNDQAEQLADYLDAALPVDGPHQGWVQSFTKAAQAQLLSEFVCRGGLDLLVKIWAWNESKTSLVEHRQLWYILAYLRYIEKHPFNERYFHQFPSINEWDGVKIEDTYWCGLTVMEALSDYVIEYGGTLGSIKHLHPHIVRAITDVYPVKTDQGTIEFHNAWDDFFQQGYDFSDVREWDEVETLVLQFRMEALSSGSVPTVEKYTLAWYEAKLKDIEQYGLPGDIERINEKIAALRRWTKADVHEQQSKLVPMLSRPTRYEHPQLTWAAWDELIRHGYIETDE